MLMRKLAVAAFSATSLIPLDAGAEEAAMRLDEIVVTPSGRGEELRTTASTVQVIDEEMIRNSPAPSSANGARRRPRSTSAAAPPTARAATIAARCWC